ncbi:hypothetical protein BZZ01_04950 [Nostocales cyanobacterium HT-58-2]|nr:hypothetical protein BZZ01_04950 [Nostocales cyanobacterium HT-58-2]
MHDIEALFSDEDDWANFATRKSAAAATPVAVVTPSEGRLGELRQKYRKTPQARNAAALGAGGVATDAQIKSMRQTAERSLQRRQTRAANVAAGLGPTGQRRGYFRTVKGKKVFVRGGSVMTRRTKTGAIATRVIDSGEKGARGLLRTGYGRGMKLAGGNKLGQRIVSGGYRAGSHVLARPGRYGAAAAGVLAAGAGAAYLLNRNRQDYSSYRPVVTFRRY